ncbi:DUF3667 domain-containing protein [Salegentibacter sp. F188]|uniref:DUF3667 domain-containing protein n=1 Tax=Autumnicola patrickiae TaxID=3075591 RepID=A0ABU3E4X7_9FLAO|nr:DUF3667 domain-containing protein [Salegentibacter sp. F188]MDT0691039.1 DUF3667 domain-containing protein [Salegentibacter sp. F188]
MKNNRSLRKYRGEECLNCGHPLDRSDVYCSNCGQLNSTKKLNFDDFFSEFFSGIFAYDSRFQRTLKALLFQPGKISKDYIQGKRARYANPFRFYLSASIIFFLLMSFTNSLDDMDFDNDREVLQEELITVPQDSLKAINEKLNKIPGLRDQQFSTDSLAAALQEEASYKEVYVTQEALDTMSLSNSSSKRFDVFSEFYKETKIANATRALDSLNYVHSRYNEWLYKKAVDWNLLMDNPQVFVTYFISKLPFIIFFYLPIFALFIWLLYIRRPFNYMEHLIFAFHVQTTFFVLYSLALLFDYFISGDWGTTIAGFTFVFYLYKALRKFYNQKRVKTVLKFVILTTIFFILAIITAAIALLASFAIY